MIFPLYPEDLCYFTLTTDGAVHIHKGWLDVKDIEQFERASLWKELT